METARPKIGIRLDPKNLKGDESVVIKPLGFMPREYFDLYLKACQKAAAEYKPTEKSMFITVDGVPPMVEALKDVGLDPIVDREVGAKLLQKAATIRGRMDSAKDRVAVINEQLAERGMSLYRFQENGVVTLASHRAYLLADEMGLGKTPQALLAAPKNAPILVICQAIMKGKIRKNGTALGGWAGEAAKFRPDLTPVILTGRGSFRWPTPGEIVIVNYDILPQKDFFLNPKLDGEASIDGLDDVDLYDLSKLPHPGTVLIVDELQHFKSSKAIRTKKLHFLMEQVRADDGYTWGLTGTPLMNRPVELWNVLNILGVAKTAFNSWTNFVRNFGGRKGAYGYTWGDPSPNVPDMLRRVMLARGRIEVLPDLPTKQYRWISAEIDAGTRKECDEVLRRLKDVDGIDLLAEGIDVAGALEEALATKGGVLFQEMSRIRERLAKAKIPTLIKLVEEYEADEIPLLVFSAHTAPVRALAEREGWGRIDGSVSNAQRSEIVNDFQEGRLRGLALTIQAGGSGLTLTHAAHEIFVDLMWTPAANAQAEDRAVRIGQTAESVLINRIVADHALDERVSELLDQKQQLIDESVNKARVSGEHLPDHADMFERAAAHTGDTDAKTIMENRRHAPETKRERWVADSMLYLSAMDPDMAREENGCGFNKLDGEFGHSLAEQLHKMQGLTPRQYHAAARMLAKYHRQIGLLPDE